MKKGYRQQEPDTDPQETEECIDSNESIIDVKGQERARDLLHTLIREAVSYKHLTLPTKRIEEI